MVHVVSLVVLAAGMAIAVWSDLKAQRIPNLLSVSLLVSGLIVNMFEPGGLSRAIIGVLVGLAVGIFLWLLGVIKAGDAKLMAAIGAVVGWKWLFSTLCWAVLIGMGIGFVILLKKRELFSRLKWVWDYGKTMLWTRKFSPYQSKEGTEGELPFAVPLAIGCILTYYIPLI